MISESVHVNLKSAEVELHYLLKMYKIKSFIHSFNQKLGVHWSISSLHACPHPHPAPPSPGAGSAPAQARDRGAAGVKVTAGELRSSRPPQGRAGVRSGRRGQLQDAAQ